MVAFAISLALPGLLVAEEDALLYDIDFSAPTHTLNATPATGFAKDRVSKVVFGSPTVVQEFGPLKDRPLLFRGRAKYDQIRLDLPEGTTSCRVAFDVATENLKDSQYNFAAYIDTPQVRVLHFHGGGNSIYKFPYDPPMTRPWVEGEISHIEIEADLTTNLWNIWKDGVLLSSSALNGSKLRSVRFSLSPWFAGAPDDLSVGVAIDNVKVWTKGAGELKGPETPGPGEVDPDDPRLYDIDFSGPVHTINSTPATGLESDRVSQVVFGSPTVVEEFGPLADRPLLFRGRSGYDQIRLDVRPGWSKYRIEYDVVTENLKDSDYSFGVTLDTPQVRNLNLHGGLNEVYNFPTPSVTEQIWRDGVASHFVIEADLEKDLWEVWQDEIRILSIPLGATDLKSVRFSLAPWIAGASGDLSVAVAVDNIKVVASNPVALTPPEKFSVTSREQAKGLLLSWTAERLAHFYRIHRGETDDFSKASRLADTNLSAYLDQTAERGVRYFYWVTSERLGFPGSAPAVASGVRGFLPVEDLSVVPDAQSVTLTWSATKGAEHYTVYRSANGDLSGATRLVRTGDSSFVDLDVVSGQTYFYWVLPGNAVAEAETGYQGDGFLSFIQPDLSVRSAAGVTAGVGITNATGTGQTVNSVTRSRRATAGEVAIGALGEGACAVVLSGPGGNRHLRTSYDLNGNVTAAMVAGRLAAAAGTEGKNVRVSILQQGSRKRASTWKTLVVPVRAGTPADGTVVDQVILRVRSQAAARKR